MPTPLKLIAGLGNPGTRYSRTRHNAGFWFLDELAGEYQCRFSKQAKFHGEIARLEAEEIECYLLKPTVFMNESGRALQAICRYYTIGPDVTLIAYDDIDLPPGTVRLKQGGGHGGHNGLRDVIPALGSPDFVRLRIGVGHPGDKDAVTGYVLNRATSEDKARIEDAVDRALALFELIVAGDTQRAMNELHRKPDEADDSA